MESASDSTEATVPNGAAGGAGSQPRTAALGLLACTALVVGNMIGSGVFLLPASLAKFGAISIAGWVLTSIGAIVLALVFGRLARVIAKPGGPYAFAREGFGDFAGFLIAWGYWIAIWAGNAAIAVAFAGYMTFLLPSVSDQNLFGLIAALAALWFVTLVNIRGISEAAFVQVVTTVLKILPLLALAVFGWFWLQADHFVPVNPSGQSDGSAIAATAALTLWAYLGLESATVPAGDVRRPEVTIPRATILGVLFAAVVYIAVTVVSIGVLPREVLSASSAPLADVARHMWGELGGMLVALGAIVSTFGTLNGFTLLSGQVPYGAALDRVFPKFFAETSRSGAPVNALIVSSVLASILVLMNFSKGLVEAFTFIILLATMTSLVPYAFCSLAEIMIRIKRGETLRSRALAGMTGLGGLGFIYSLLAIYGSGQDVVFYGFLLLLAGIPVFVLIRYRQARTKLTESPNS
ncbi:amino acid permease [Roseibium sp. RKSG952]|uniref:amino acid permease n=1 Tax=Roseibium sp. RKSG952 TaxID=2529384 RepID=UPI0012BBE6F0|nr:amino acid permease [Roseibium sp. RKSG952]MTH99081.1 amino acid permease [Roseibium sp. RKSG952]